ncbi:hypothetical protein A3D01_02930 [Candidatus Woesebacteria bacterium RIFCSPHIGHO2_02_FULL_39_13]|uniref:Peptidase C39-like domain-containing protein n=1 Tax=Candidatus Woesebacteria bacterium RIFCSPHIGHO2_02_FULL_39_13 TaxID=1802505 RepID=A0A1F7YXV7_9BACT|nr:MAG: hypothetical protein A3D01_02930 [Candidatus Woesebacteria bacterium RIFCSPHIGHO2_02_FULL_39_13]OGM36893.1 MAG: hypothetical protein A3E13_01870 [Candidatus Woesebacteria bacterium RIFCSPHIGHO2_12_FULL_40_20]OGM72132.1 MAG: hypothetical protein A3H19_05580 [Candidatus Woesebacteria bacterium RIFCSPLOWO2_12_FULL_39_9]
MTRIKTDLNWERIHRFQKKPGWCGPAVLQMMFLASGIKKSQTAIAQAVYKPWWGTDQQIIIAYLSKYFDKLSFKSNATIKDIKKKLKSGYLVLVDWWDDFDADDPDGHYTLIISYDTKSKKIKMADPSNEREGIWNMDKDEFEKRWYDSLDTDGRKWINGWMLWVDPTSKKKPL